MIMKVKRVKEGVNSPRTRTQVTPEWISAPQRRLRFRLESRAL